MIVIFYMVLEHLFAGVREVLNELFKWDGQFAIRFLFYFVPLFLALSASCACIYCNRSRNDPEFYSMEVTDV